MSGGPFFDGAVFGGGFFAALPGGGGRQKRKKKEKRPLYHWEEDAPLVIPSVPELIAAVKVQTEQADDAETEDDAILLSVLAKVLH